jgi:outer membrane biosynthesis protein TonB
MADKGKDDGTTLEGEIIDEQTGVVSQALTFDPITRAEIDIQISTAKRYPRDLVQFKKDMLEMVTLDEETAEGCYYSLKRRDADGTVKVIQGPSVRLAEMALSAFGNVRAGTRSLGETEDGRFVRELGLCHDVQKNVWVAMEVTRRITTSKGKRYGDDMIGVTRAAAGAIAFRNATFKVIPRAMIKPYYERAKEVAAGKTKSLTVRRSEVIERLKKRSPLITNERILAAVEKPDLESIGWPEIEHLIGLGTALKEGMQTVEEAFPAPQAASTGVAEVLGEKPQAPAQPKAPEGAQQAVAPAQAPPQQPAAPTPAPEPPPAAQTPPAAPQQAQTPPPVQAAAQLPDPQPQPAPAAPAQAPAAQPEAPKAAGPEYLTGGEITTIRRIAEKSRVKLVRLAAIVAEVTGNPASEVEPNTWQITPQQGQEIARRVKAEGAK